MIYVRRKGMSMVTTLRLSALLLVGVTGCIVGVRGQMSPPNGKEPARILKERILPSGEREVTVRWEDGFEDNNGRRMAYVSDYPCIKTVRAAQGLVKQERGRCFPKVVFTPETMANPVTTEQIPEGVNVLESQDKSNDQKQLYIDYLRKMYNLELQKTSSLLDQVDLLSSQLNKCELDQI